jgi:Heterokaryon incompatibility protein (HET)
MTSIASNRLWDPRPSRARSRSRSRSRERYARSSSSSERRPIRSQRRPIRSQRERPRVISSSFHGTSQLHQPIPKGDSIRLLYVRKHRRELFHEGKKDRFLDCQLVVRHLPRPERSYKYNALSYYWGSSNDDCHILCNEQFTKVSSTLLEALTQYRNSNHSDPLWVDALCINQDDLEERNHQVHLMAEIYERADLVIAWLGRCSRKVEMAFDRLHYGRPRWENTDIVLETEMSDEGEEIVRPARGQACRARYLQSRLEKGLVQLFSKPWFSRCWVFQEILLARNAVVWCGALEMNWSAFVDRCWNLEDGTEGMNPDVNRLCFDAVLNVEVLRVRFRSKRETRPSLSKILIDTWQRKATVPQDHIFSVLGLVEGTVLQADYSLSTRETYMAAARACILQDEHLGILCLTELTQTTLERANDQVNVELPSWVPRWGSPGKHPRLSDNSSHPDFGALSMSLAAKRRLLRNPDELALQGVAIGYLEAPEKLFDLELRPFLRCAPCYTNQSFDLDELLRIENPEQQDRAIDLLDGMSYFYKTGSCLCTQDKTWCIARTGFPCQRSTSGPSELPSLSLPGDWVCAVRGGTGYLILRPKRDGVNGSRPTRQDKFSLIGVTSYTLTSKILSKVRSQQVARTISESSLSTTIGCDWVFRAMEIIVA